MLLKENKEALPKLTLLARRHLTPVTEGKFAWVPAWETRTTFPVTGGGGLTLQLAVLRT